MSRKNWRGAGSGVCGGQPPKGIGRVVRSDPGGKAWPMWKPPGDLRKGIEMTEDLVKRLRTSLSMLAQEEAADRIEELEAQVKEDALQYLSDTGQMGETIDDLTRRHEHALRKIDVLEAKLEECLECNEQFSVEAKILKARIEELEAAVSAAYRQGQRDMRERAASQMDEFEQSVANWVLNGKGSIPPTEVVASCRNIVRALPIKEVIE